MKKGIVVAGMSLISGLLAAQAALVTNYWTGGTSADVNNAANWAGGTPLNKAGTNVGVIDSNGANAPTFAAAVLNNTTIIVNNSATLTATAAINAAYGMDLTFNNSSVLNAANNAVTLGRYAGAANKITLNDSASLTNGGAIQIGREGQGIVNQNGGTVTATQIILGYSGLSTTNRYNLAGGSVTTTSALGFNGADAGADSGSYFNFASGSTGQLTVKSSSYNFGALIDAGKIRVNDVKLTGTDEIWNIDNSVSGQTTLSLVPEPATVGLFLLSSGVLFLARRWQK